MTAKQRQSHAHIEVTMNKSCNFEWPFHRSMTNRISSTVLMESMDYVAMLDQLPGTDFRRLSCHSNLLNQEWYAAHNAYCDMCTHYWVTRSLSLRWPARHDVNWHPESFIYMRNRGVKLVVKCSVMLLPVMMAVLSDCWQQTDQGAIEVFQHAWGW